VATPAHDDTNWGYLEATATKWRNDSVNNAMQFFKMQLLRAALPGDIHKVIAQHDPNTMTLDDMYQIATTTQRETGAKITKTIAVVNDKTYGDHEDEDEEIAAFQKWKPSNTLTKRRSRTLHTYSPSISPYARTRKQLQREQEIPFLL
jgi:hypothetical protein